ncbi:MAG TPA: TIGR00282 family metallophosphoesterase [Firmicutes bacterium]|jgi:metallophosphoesterase (TIGR00282 family)|nr:TIGR00282 family metallophosphoesterase [Bacillota bacterium]HOQ23656.1 TIGR00282 family metallophosphoesterase [Bacillota bacterium]HPT67072.1 TIGR00282 family metallophosphoesterase [Bacillota bacterium]
MRLVFLGDIVGKPGRAAVRKKLPEIRRQYRADLVVANGENAAGGFGLNLDVTKELLDAGIDVITLGNHTWKNREIFQVLEREERVLRPANYPPDTPGRGAGLFTAANGELVGVFNLLGQVYLEALDCPFRMGLELAAELRRKTPYVLLDMHAEATSEKIALARYLDGKVSAVLGTHTHVTTADETILPQGTGYITDVGMCGPVDSVLGVLPELAIRKFVTKLPVRFEVASGPVAICGVILELQQNGSTQVIERFKVMA